MLLGWTITPIVKHEMGSNQFVTLNNGFLSFVYLHPKFHVYDLPSDKVNINDEDETLFNNVTRMKKQECSFPMETLINPYKLITTGIGTGAVEKLSINLDSLQIKATIKHDTE